MACRSQLAGVPAAVIRSARRHLADLEAAAAAHAPQGDLFAASSAKADAPPTEPHPVIDALRDVDPDALTPRDALDLLYRLQAMARDDT